MEVPSNRAILLTTSAKSISLFIYYKGSYASAKNGTRLLRYLLLRLSKFRIEYRVIAKYPYPHAKLTRIYIILLSHIFRIIGYIS
jgi:hypothetical protein